MILNLTIALAVLFEHTGALEPQTLALAGYALEASASSAHPGPSVAATTDMAGICVIFRVKRDCPVSSGAVSRTWLGGLVGYSLPLEVLLVSPYEKVIAISESLWFTLSHASCVAERAEGQLMRV